MVIVVRVGLGGRSARNVARHSDFRTKSGNTTTRAPLSCLPSATVGAGALDLGQFDLGQRVYSS